MTESGPDQRGAVAVVTGAGSGIGRAVAVGLAGAGYQVVLAGRRSDALAGTAVQAARVGSPPLSVAADVRDPAEVAALFARTVTSFGRVDLLFNNAGRGSSPRPVEDVSLEEWTDVVATNLTGSFLCAQAAFRIMKEQRPQGGRIINNGSLSAHVPRPHSVAYTASKHGVTGLTRSLSLEGRPYRIACGQIDIGNAATDMTARMPGGVLQADGQLSAEPLMDVEAVVQAVVYMAALPLEANVQFLTVLATAMPFIGRG